MASDIGPDNAWMEKPGFWHLLHDEDRNWEQEYKERGDHMKHLLHLQEYKLGGAHEEAWAIKNIIAVMRYIVGSSSHQSRDVARDNLEHFREDPNFNHSKINILGNLAGVYHRENRQEEATAIEEMLNDYGSTDLEVARSMCEKGYFCLYHVVGEVSDIKWKEKAAKLLAEGLRRSEVAQMSRTEQAVWRFYLLEAMQDIFVAEVVVLGNTGAYGVTNRDDITEDQRRAIGRKLGDLVAAYDKFHDLWTEERESSSHLSKHMDRANIIMATVFIRQLRVIDQSIVNRSDNLSSFYRRIVEQIERSDNFDVLDEACGRNRDDYEMHIKAVRLYTYAANFQRADQLLRLSNEAIDVQDISEEVKHARKQNGITCMAQLFYKRAVAHRADIQQAFRNRNLEEERRLVDESLRWFKEGFNYIKTIDEEHSYWARDEHAYLASTTYVEMADICLNIAVDRNRWEIRRQSRDDRNNYLAEAIAYGLKAEKGLNKTPRLYSTLHLSYQFTGNQAKEFEYAKKLVLSDTKISPKNVKSYLISAMRHHGENAREDVVQTLKPICNQYLRERSVSALVNDCLMRLNRENSDRIMDYMQWSREQALHDVAQEWASARRARYPPRTSSGRRPYSNTNRRF